MIEVRDLRKSYTTGSFTQRALDGISITFRENEFVSVLGPSGSGKTTLLNVLGGLDHPDSGDIVINGVSTKDYKSAIGIPIGTTTSASFSKVTTLFRTRRCFRM